MDKLSVIIVNFNCGDILADCLKSFQYNKGKIKLDIWVVDNASCDDSIENCKKIFPDIHYILNDKNLGYSTANNQALRKIKTEFVLLLNPDTQVSSDTLQYMINFMEENPAVGAATCKPVQSDGKMDWAYHRGFPTPLASLLYFLGNDSLYHLTSRDMSKIHEVDAISGSFFMTRKYILDKIGLLDEDYWMYGEDLDICYRMKKAGYKIMYIPDVKVKHLKGVSSGLKCHSQKLTTATIDSKLLAFNSFYETMKIFYKKNLSDKYPFFINWLVYFAINLKWFWAKRKMVV